MEVYAKSTFNVGEDSLPPRPIENLAGTNGDIPARICLEPRRPQLQLDFAQRTFTAARSHPRQVLGILGRLRRGNFVWRFHAQSSRSSEESQAIWDAILSWLDLEGSWISFNIPVNESLIYYIHLYPVALIISHSTPDDHQGKLWCCLPWQRLRWILLAMCVARQPFSSGSGIFKKDGNAMHRKLNGMYCVLVHVMLHFY